MDAFNIHTDLRRLELILKRRDIMEVENSQIISNVLSLSYEASSHANQVR